MVGEIGLKVSVTMLLRRSRSELFRPNYLKSGHVVYSSPFLGRTTESVMSPKTPSYLVGTVTHNQCVFSTDSKLIEDVTSNFFTEGVEGSHKIPGTFKVVVVVMGF